MSRLLLVKHALPHIEPDRPATRWRLGETGRAQSFRLAEALRPHGPSVVITSDEPKAVETGQLVAGRLELPCTVAPGLHEQDNAGTPYFDTRAEFEGAVRSLFDEPGRRAYGNESAEEALGRFEKAVEAALEPHPHKNAVIVAHGRINTLFVAAHNPLDAFAFWKAWQLGTFSVLSRPHYRVLEPPQPLE